MRKRADSLRRPASGRSSFRRRGAGAEQRGLRRGCRDASGAELETAARTVRLSARRPGGDGDRRLRSTRLADPLHRQLWRRRSRSALARKPGGRERGPQRRADGAGRDEPARRDSRRSRARASGRCCGTAIPRCAWTHRTPSCARRPRPVACSSSIVRTSRRQRRGDGRPAGGRSDDRRHRGRAIRNARAASGNRRDHFRGELSVRADRTPGPWTGARGNRARIPGAAGVRDARRERQPRAVRRPRNSNGSVRPSNASTRTGAGDVFRGGFASGCLRWPEGDIETVLAYANAAAALSCRALGARGGLPRPGKSTRFWARGPVSWRSSL